MTEADIQNSIRLALSRVGCRLFRNHVGKYRTVDGRTYSHGLCPGSADLIGWLTVSGRALFVAVEVKTPAGRATQAQRNFIDRVNAAGGIGFFATSASDALQKLQEHPHVARRRYIHDDARACAHAAQGQDSGPEIMDHPATPIN